MLNQCSFIGNLGADPDVRTMSSGDKVVNLNIAVSESWKDKSTGQRKEKTEWVKAVVFGGLTSVCENYLKKGSKVFISGKLQTRTWDKDGTKQYTTEIVLQGFDAKLIMLGGKEIKEDHQAPLNNDMDDEIPF